MKITTAVAGIRGETAGASLTEVLVSVVLVATFTVSLYGGLSSGFTITQLTREDLRATQILMQKVEGIRLCNWGQLSNCPISFCEYYDPLGATNGLGGTAYQGTITTGVPTQIPDTALYKTGMVSVRVSLYWTNYSTGKAIPQTRFLETYAAQCGLQNYIWGKTK